MEAFGFRGRLDWTGETIERGVDAAMDIATKERPGAHEPNPSQKSIASLCLSLARWGRKYTYIHIYKQQPRNAWRLHRGSLFSLFLPLHLPLHVISLPLDINLSFSRLFLLDFSRFMPRLFSLLQVRAWAPVIHSTQHQAQPVTPNHGATHGAPGRNTQTKQVACSSQTANNANLQLPRGHRNVQLICN
jgi:hypothetical protein